MERRSTRGRQPPPNPYLAAGAAALMALTLLAVLLDRNPAMTSGLAFLGVVLLLFAVLIPRMSGDVTLSPGGLRFSIGALEPDQLERASEQLQAGEVVPVTELIKEAGGHMPDQHSNDPSPSGQARDD
ncbi:MAG: hypothetical protein QOD92_3129 [Acidimicrobiaceae bacterium]